MLDGLVEVDGEIVTRLGTKVDPRTAVIYEKPWTVVHPDYVWRHTEAWIDFPWSAQPPLVRRDRGPA